MIGRVRRAVAGVALALALTSCATFPDAGPRDWREKVEGAGELGGPPLVPDPGPPSEEQGSPQAQKGISFHVFFLLPICPTPSCGAGLVLTSQDFLRRAA